MKLIYRYLLSLNTAFGAFLSLVSVCMIGSFSLVNNLAFFSGIDETPLFRWLASNPAPKTTWWIYGMIALLVLLALSTIVCTAEALLKRMGRRNLLMKLSPQVMHIGVLFIMLGHLLTAIWGFKLDLPIQQGEVHQVGQSGSLVLENLAVSTDEHGYFTDWKATVRWNQAGAESVTKSLRPVHPVYFGRYGLFIRSAAAEPRPSALIMVSRDPGAFWALVGGILLCAGGIGFAYSRFSGLK